MHSRSISKRALSTFCLAVLGALAISSTPSLPRARYLSFPEAQPILLALNEILPAELRGKSAAVQASLWPAWVQAQDAATRARLRRGDEDTLVNFLLFGTSFTRQPRATAQDLARLKAAPDSADALINARIDDLSKALGAPGGNERRLFLRQLITQQRLRLDAAGRAALRAYLKTNLRRVLDEQASYTQTLAAARAQGNASAEFIERSKLYQHRGLSLDTTLAPSFAIEESLKAMQVRGLLTAPVRRIAVIGPGLDFTDKAAGYDFYPPQTTQPFALIDSLLRLGLARADDWQMTVFDLSPRVLAHLRGAQERAARGQGYTVQLPHDPQARWRPELVKFWQSFGDQIGQAARPAAVPSALRDLQLRAVRIKSAVAARLDATDLNVVYQRLPQPANFDLIIATNILVYYGVFEQALALSNIESMLRPGGFLLSNNALLELPALKMRSVGYLTVVYSERADDGDHIVWYQRSQ